MKTLNVFVLVGLLVLSGMAENSYAKETGEFAWPQWLGPNRNGISAETGIIKRWPDAGPQILWRAGSGDGYSAMAVVNGRLYTCYGKATEELAVCLDANSGKTLWSYKMDSKFDNDMGNGPRSTPTLDGNIVFVLSAQANLVALDAAKGTEIWKHNLPEKFGAQIPTWGVATSPLVYGDYLLVDVGGKGDFGFVAFNKKTGAVVWKTATELPGYSAPVAVSVNGVKQVLNFAGKELMAVAPMTGKKLWSMPWQTSYDVNAATPVFISPDKVFISSGYNVGGALLKIDGTSMQQVWKSREMRNHFATCLYINGYLYGFDDANFKCMNASTQEVKWEKRGFGKGSAIYADGQIILLSEKGQLVLIEATPGEYREKASAQLLQGRCWTAPALVNKKLYIRNQQEILAINMAK